MQTFSTIDGPFTKTILPILRTFQDTRIYLVGGAVRDTLLGKASHDLDFIVEGDVYQIARAAADKLKGAFFILDNERRYARVIFHDDQDTRIMMDFAPVYENDIQRDLRARDFTINALAWDISADEGDLIDPCGGERDLQEKVLEICSANAFTQDAVRIIRVARFAAEYDLQISDQIKSTLADGLAQINTISEERKRDELFKILENASIEKAILLLEELGILNSLLPELLPLIDFQQGSHHNYDGWNHTLHVLRYCRAMVGHLYTERKRDIVLPQFQDVEFLLDDYRDYLLKAFAQTLVIDRPMVSLFMFAALYHDVGKPKDEAIEKDGRPRYIKHPDLGRDLIGLRARKMALAKTEIMWLETFVENHMLPYIDADAISEMDRRTALFHFYQRARHTSPILALFSLADLLATYGENITAQRWELGLRRARMVLQGYYQEYDKLVDPIPLLNGNEIQFEFDVPPGKKIGVILNDLRRAQASGAVHTKQDARSWIRAFIRENGSD